MQIERLERTRTRPARIRLVFDSGAPLIVSDEIVARFSLGRGDELTESRWEEIAAAQEEFEGRRIAINYLSYRPRAEREIVRHLERKGISTGVAEGVASRLRTMNMVDDAAFTRMFVKDQIRKRRHGPLVIRQKLLEKGVARTVADAVLAELLEPGDEAAAAARLLSARVRKERASAKPVSPAVRRQRWYEFLVRKGFSSDVARKTINTMRT